MLQTLKGAHQSNIQNSRLANMLAPVVNKHQSMKHTVLAAFCVFIFVRRLSATSCFNASLILSDESPVQDGNRV